MNFIKKMFDVERKELKKYNLLVDQIVDLDDEMQKLTDKELKAKTSEFKKRLEGDDTLSDILVEAFAVAREASARVNNEKPFPTQLLVGIICHEGNIAEMKTGEGKTLATVLPAYLNALGGDQVHIITVNEYLSQRNAEWMGNIYNFLGLKVGANLRDLSKEEKIEIYSSDILYTTNAELGFDYLRDNMIVHKKDRLVSSFDFAIIDEVDSILIDEARTPLIISGGNLQTTNIYVGADSFVRSLKENKGYVYDEKTKIATLSEEGAHAAEKFFNIGNLYDLDNTSLVHRINQSLRANYTMKKEVDYLVKEDKIVIVDPFTGRLMAGRAFSEGLHQAIEAKEKVTIREETKTIATITLQNLFRMYKKLSGLTGTAKTEEEEFRETYNMYVLEVPTFKPIARIDRQDKFFSKQEYKYKALVKEIKERHKLGQPILVGTVAVETSELIGSFLTKAKVKHEILNAKNHGREAEIIANAGKKGSVTIATNMAGRGTDIKIDDEIRELGGLCVLGTERHESRRIDNQLRGRAGRQGDPGFSQFYVAAEDELLVRFGSDRMKGLLEKVGLGSELAIENKMLSKIIENAQKKIEGSNFDQRKFLLQYDDVISRQREIIYEKRNNILDTESIHEEVKTTISSYIEVLIKTHIYPENRLTELDINEIIEIVNENVLTKHRISNDDLTDYEIKNVTNYITNLAIKDYDEKLSIVDEESRNQFEKAVYLRIVDTLWMEHIGTMAHLKEGVNLRSYGQENPVRVYTMEGFDLFDGLLQRINKQVTVTLLKAEIKNNQEVKPVVKKIRTNDGKESVKRKPVKKDKIKRNDPCPCGSGKKYKQCCGKEK